MTGLLDRLRSLDTAEDLLDHFAIPYDQRIVDVNRLHILQRLHDRLREADVGALDDGRLHLVFSDLLARAYRDFVTSDARTEKVFRVFHRGTAAGLPEGAAVIPLDQIRGVPVAERR